ncbi:MAG: hypothetical protein WCT14_10465 [Treponemataceae bacterium]
MRPLVKAFAPVLALIFALIPAAEALAQNTLLDNPNHRKSLDLKRMAEKAYEEGDFEKSLEYSTKAEELSKTALSEAETERMRFVSYSFLRRATKRVEFCEHEDAATRYPDIWPLAQTSYAAAKTAFDSKEYESSIEASKKVIEILSAVMPKDRTFVAKSEPPKPAPPKVEPAAAPILPASYTVRLILPLRDCLWRIAAYPFVYGDPLKWKVLYDANKDKLPVAANPDLILPGIVLTIPSINGEKRDGEWKE